MNPFLHESLMRGEDALKKIAEVHITVCGLGAIGSNLSENLARQGFKDFYIIDFDRIEEHNIGTQSYHADEVGMLKASALSSHLYRISKAQVEYTTVELHESNVKKLLARPRIVIDSFDNRESRKVVTEFCLEKKLPCLHVGVNEYYSEAVWNENYRVPQDNRGVDACNYPLARNTIMLAVVIASEVLIRYVLTGEKKSYFSTLKDFSIAEVDL